MLEAFGLAGWPNSELKFGALLVALPGRVAQPPGVRPSSGAECNKAGGALVNYGAF